MISPHFLWRCENIWKDWGRFSLLVCMLVSWVMAAYLVPHTPGHQDFTWQG